MNNTRLCLASFVEIHTRVCNKNPQRKVGSGS